MQNLTLAKQETSGGKTAAKASFNLIMIFLMVGVVATDAGLSVSLGVSGVLNGIAYPCLAAAVFAVIYYFYPAPTIQQLALLAMWMFVVTSGLSILIQLAGRSPAPVVDANLAKLDSVIGFSTASVVRSLARHPAIRESLEVIYSSPLLLLLAAIVIPPYFGRERDSQRLILSVTIAGILTAALFAILPAAGPWMVSGFAPTAEQANEARYLALLKSSGPMRLDSRLAGVVAFPSFHVVLAILPAIALWPIRRIRYVAATLAATVCVSTVTTGWHYLTDVFGAGAVVLISHKIATWALSACDSNSDESASQQAAVGRN